jgi:hypothetical protein
MLREMLVQLGNIRILAKESYVVKPLLDEGCSDYWICGNKPNCRGYKIQES